MVFQESATRFKVEGWSIECVRCGSLFSRFRAKWSALKEGDACPKACGGTLCLRWHLCDCGIWHPVGQCDCEGWNMSKRKELGDKTPKQYVERLTRRQLDALSHRETLKLQCYHLEAAWFALAKISVARHEEWRGNLNCREETAP